VRAELKAGFLPGVTVVPAMVAAMAMAQAKGAAYVYAGA
jgi:intracellular sulfur oxidation DsrE/DsrF family protein